MTDGEGIAGRLYVTITQSIAPARRELDDHRRIKRPTFLLRAAEEGDHEVVEEAGFVEMVRTAFRA